eukprot:15078146-Alexandrium_andersonii.AAC.1
MVPVRLFVRLRWPCRGPAGQPGLSVAGDNLGVVRYAAGAGRLRRPALCVVLERPLSDLAARGLRVTWQA